jgi:hypothetical protein
MWKIKKKNTQIYEAIAKMRVEKNGEIASIW